MTVPLSGGRNFANEIETSSWTEARTVFGVAARNSFTLAEEEKGRSETAILRRLCAVACGFTVY